MWQQAVQDLLAFEKNHGRNLFARRAINDALVGGSGKRKRKKLVDDSGKKKRKEIDVVDLVNDGDDGEPDPYNLKYNLNFLLSDRGEISNHFTHIIPLIAGELARIFETTVETVETGSRPQRVYNRMQSCFVSPLMLAKYHSRDVDPKQYKKVLFRVNGVMLKDHEKKANNSTHALWFRFMRRKRLPYVTLYGTGYERLYGTHPGDGQERPQMCCGTRDEKDGAPDELHFALRSLLVWPIIPAERRSPLLRIWGKLNAVKKNSNLMASMAKDFHMLHVLLGEPDSSKNWTSMPKDWFPAQPSSFLNVEANTEGRLRLEKILVQENTMNAILTAMCESSPRKIVHVPTEVQNMDLSEILAPYPDYLPDTVKQFLEERVKANTAEYLIVPRHVFHTGVTNGGEWKKDVRDISGQKGNHWQLVIVRITDARFDCYVFDSLNYLKNGLPLSTCCHGALYHMAVVLGRLGLVDKGVADGISVKEAMTVGNIHVHQCRCSKQSDGKQCGFYVMINALYFLKYHVALRAGAYLNWEEILPGLDRALGYYIGNMTRPARLNNVRMYFQSMYERIALCLDDSVDDVAKQGYMQYFGADDMTLTFEQVLRPVTFLDQGNGYDCGVYTCMIIAHLCAHPDDITLSTLLTEENGLIPWDSTRQHAYGRHHTLWRFTPDAIRAKRDEIRNTLKSLVRDYPGERREGSRNQTIRYIHALNSAPAYKKWDAVWDERLRPPVDDEGLPVGWLNDEIIDIFLQHAAAGRGVTVLTAADARTVQENHEYDHEDIKLPCLIPINSGSHWYVVYVTADKSMFVYNSLWTTGDCPMVRKPVVMGLGETACLPKLQKWLKHKFP